MSSTGLAAAVIGPSQETAPVEPPSSSPSWVAEAAGKKMRYQGEGREGEHQMSALGRREEGGEAQEGGNAAAALLSLVGAGRSTRVSEIGLPWLALRRPSLESVYHIVWQAFSILI